MVIFSEVVFIVCVTLCKCLIDEEFNAKDVFMKRMLRCAIIHVIRETVLSGTHSDKPFITALFSIGY